MNDFYITRLLPRRQVDQAYAVVRTVISDLQVDGWRRFAASLLLADDDGAWPAGSGDADGAGAGDRATMPSRSIMTVQSDRGYIHGLFSYGVEEHLRHGRILAVDNFMVVDMFNPAGTASLLLRAMDQIAHILGCKAIHATLPASYTELPEYYNAVLSYFRNQGHAVDTLRLCKTLDQANDNYTVPMAPAAQPARQPTPLTANLSSLPPVAAVTAEGE